MMDSTSRGVRDCQTIYFDESGFTGNNLLNPEQPVFVYASVAIDPHRASILHSELISRFDLRGKELKGRSLVGQKRGRDAISWLLDECSDSSRISVFDKKFALACKFFEYIFEPVLAAKNSFFYAVGFHKFIATFLYIMFQSKDAYAEDILREFESLMRYKDTRHLALLLSSADRGITLAGPLGQIITFALCHQKRIGDEVRSLKEFDSVSKWALELTGTALFWLLSYWGERFDSLDVYCDKSKPLEADQSLFDAMIGRQDKIYMRLGGRPEVAMTFNLVGPLNLVESHHYPGVQIADILASSIAYALKNPDEELSRTWLDIVDNKISGESVVPGPELIDLHRKEPFINAMLLGELTDRAVKGTSLLDDLEEFLVVADCAYWRFVLEGEPPVI